MENQLHRFFLISIHAPTRGATGAGHTIDNMDLNFNPRSYKRSDKVVIQTNVDDGISIHAPTRGATDGGYKGAGETVISIHAPTRGATSGNI